MKIRLFLIILFYSLIPRCFSQIDSATIFKQKTIEGYFVCYRDTIEKTPPDMVLSRYDFTIFFFNKLDDSVLLSLKTMKLSKTGFTVISGGINYLIAESKLHKQYIHYLIDNNLFNKAHDYNIFNFSKVDEDLIASNKSLISIFKGKLTVVGPFLPNIRSFDLPKLKLYMYLPFESNKMEYLFTLLY